MAVEIGLTGKASFVIVPSQSAREMGSGDLDVFSTPCLVGLMEEACWKSIASSLSEGESSVGVEMTVSHLAATPIGMEVWAESMVTAVDGKRIHFTVTAYDEAGEIGKGSHARFVVSAEKFMARIQSKSSND